MFRGRLIEKGGLGPGIFRNFPELPTRIICVLALLAALSVPSLFAGDTVQALDWSRMASGGFRGAANSGVQCMAWYGGVLYAGTYNPGGCEVWSFDGTAWTPEVGQGASGSPTAPGFGDADAVSVSSMAVYRSRLYVGTRNPGGCEVWSVDGTAWTPEVGQGASGSPTAPGFGDAGNNDVPSMAVCGDQLYAGTYNSGGCEVWSYEGKEWKRVAETGFGNAGNHAASSMAAYLSRLYVGTFNNDYTSGCEVWSFDGTAWTPEVGQGASGSPTAPGFGDPDNRRVSSMAVYDAVLYLGTYDSSGGNGCQVWSHDGANWTRMEPGGFGDSKNITAASMAADGLNLYVGTVNEDTGCEVWSFDGASWSRENLRGFGSVENVAVDALVAEGSFIYAGTRNASGCQVWTARSCQVAYFAEGYTGAGFDEYLCLGNPQAVEVRAAVSYLFPDGTSLARVVRVPPEARLTIYVNADVGPDREVAAKVESAGAVTAERTMYFVYGGTLRGGHDAAGAATASRRWYFAEGYTGLGFEEWISVLNPGAASAELTFRFQTSGEGEIEKSGFEVPAFSRRSFKVNDFLGAGYECSLELLSSSPVVAERPMYFDYLGTSSHHWQGGHCVMGSTELAQVYFFAEGTSRAGFEEWLTLQNPNPRPIMVSATFQPASGQGEAVSKTYAVAAGKRHTVYVPGEVGAEKDVSVVLASTSFYLAERPMYFRYGGYGADWDGGDCAAGIRQAASKWFLAEGYTGEGFHTWLCLQNPGLENALVAVRYLTQEEGALPVRTLELPAGTRQTVFVNEHAGAGYQLSIEVSSSRPIVVERPMYFLYGGDRAGGH